MARLITVQGGNAEEVGGLIAVAMVVGDQRQASIDSK